MVPELTRLRRCLEGLCDNGGRSPLVLSAWLFRCLRNEERSDREWLVRSGRDDLEWIERSPRDDPPVEAASTALLPPGVDGIFFKVLREDEFDGVLAPRLNSVTPVGDKTELAA